MAHRPSSPHDAPGRVIAYTLPDGWQVLVGRTDADNDYVSFRVARPEDWWFHVRGMPGSHVILQGPLGADATARPSRARPPSRRTTAKRATRESYQSPAHAPATSASRVARKPAPCRSGTNGCSRCARRVATWRETLEMPPPNLPWRAAHRSARRRCWPWSACAHPWRPAVRSACAGAGPRVMAGVGTAAARGAGAPLRPPTARRGS